MNTTRRNTPPAKSSSSLVQPMSAFFKNKRPRARFTVPRLEKLHERGVPGTHACTITERRYVCIAGHTTGFCMLRQAREASSSSKSKAPPMTSPAELEVKRLQVHRCCSSPFDGHAQ